MHQACPKKTLVILTGGTIEALYDPAHGTPYYVPVPARVEDSAIPGALEKLGLRDACDIYPLRMKDSKQITTADLDHILVTLAEGDYNAAVVVHGTDTMPIHARYLKRRLAEYGAEQGMDDKRIIFTGAMYPLRDAQGQWRDPAVSPQMNDGWENLRRAVAQAPNAAPGVYLEMGQGLWDADSVTKHVQTENDRPDTKVRHSEFQRLDPERTRDVRF